MMTGEVHPRRSVAGSASIPTEISGGTIICGITISETQDADGLYKLVLTTDAPLTVTEWVGGDY